MWLIYASVYAFFAIIAYEYEKSLNPSKTRALLHAAVWLPKIIFKFINMMSKK